MTTNEILCSNILALRKNYGLSQETLADRLGITFQAVSKWENNISCPDISLIPAIADIFNVSIDYLFKNTAEFPYPDNVIHVNWADDNNIYVVSCKGHSLLTSQELSSMPVPIEVEYDGPVNNIYSRTNITIKAARVENCIIHAGTCLVCADIYAHQVHAGTTITAADIYANQLHSGTSINAADITCENIHAGISIHSSSLKVAETTDINRLLNNSNAVFDKLSSDAEELLRIQQKEGICEFNKFNDFNEKTCTLFDSFDETNGLREEINDLMDELNEKKDELSDLTDEVSDITDEVNDLNSEIDDKCMEIDVLQCEIEKIKSELSIKSKELEMFLQK